MENDNYVSLNHKDLGALAIHTKTSPEIIQEVSLVKKQGNYNLRNQIDFLTPQVKSINYDLERIQILRPKIYETLPNDFINKESVDSFKTAIKRWKPVLCPSRLCKTYI